MNSLILPPLSMCLQQMDRKGNTKEGRKDSSCGNELSMWLCGRVIGQGGYVEDVVTVEKGNV